MKYLSLLLVMTLLGACAAGSKDDAGTGAAEHVLDCSGSDLDWEDCEASAKSVCGDGAFDIVEKYEDRGAFAAYDSARVLPTRLMHVNCRK